MINMTLDRIAAACHGKLFRREGVMNREATGVVIDSRLVAKDYIFIATVGERVDGHNYIENAFQKGALAVICEKEPSDAKGPYILVENSLVALKELAKWYRQQLNIKIVGITGSVGKTSTKEFISSVLSKKYCVLKTEGNYNNEIGMPLTILKIREEHQVAVLEMGISQFGEMHRLSEIAKPDICVITNIGQCHLENLGSREGILKAKTEIFDFMRADGRVCINGDDDMLATINEVNGKKPITFGINSSNDIYVTDVVSHGLFGSSCMIHLANTEFHTDIPLPGGHMLLNAMAAVSVGTLLDMTYDEMKAGIESVLPVGGRSHIILHEKYTIIDDCYNANPVSMMAAVDLLDMADTRKVAILGDMFELGSTENALHKEVGAYAAAKTDVLVCVGNLSSHMYDGAREYLKEMQVKSSKAIEHRLLYFKTREALIDELPEIINDNDTILVKASHGMGFDHIVKVLSQ